jgi:glycosyltransferase involved in cell wall biosynthesis
VGFVVEKDPTEIATAIKRFFDENLAQKLKTGVEEEKKKYLWSTFVKKIEEFSDSL